MPLARDVRAIYKLRLRPGRNIFTWSSIIERSNVHRAIEPSTRGREDQRTRGPEDERTNQRTRGPTRGREGVSLRSEVPKQKSFYELFRKLQNFSGTWC